MTKLEGASKAQLLDKIEDAMRDVLDEGSFGVGVSDGGLVAHLATVALNAAESELTKIEDAMWDVLDEGSFGLGVGAGELVAHLATVALNAVESELNKGTN